MPSRSQPSWTSGYCASRARAAASASSSLPSWMSASTAFDASVGSSSHRSSANSSSSSEPSSPANSPASLASMAARTSRRLWRFSAAWFSRCAWAAASRSCSTASSFVKQHALYFLPLPQGQRSLRPGLAIRVWPQAEKDGFLVRNAAGGCQIPRTAARLRRRSRRRRTRRAMPALRRCAAFGQVQAQAQGPRLQARPRARPALQLLLRRRRLPGPRDAGVAALSRPPRLCRAIVVLIAILKHGATDARLARLSDVASVDRRTIARWRHWWRDAFTATPFWRIARARFMPPVDHDRVPVELIERFTGDGAEPLIALLRFLGPITGGAAMQAR